MELWKKVPGYEGYYEASSFGRIRSVDRFVDHKINGRTMYRGKVISTRLSIPSGYLHVGLTVHGKSKSYTVHRLIMYAFHGKDEKSQINHKNGIKTDNRVENLEYCTQSQNIKHAYDTGLMRGHKMYGSKGSTALLTTAQVNEIRDRYSRGGITQKEIAKKYGVCRHTILNIIKKHTYAFE